MSKKRTEPTYQLHKASGQARTVIDGKSIYLGIHGSPESQERFNDLKAEWRLRQSVEQYTLTVDELALRYLVHADAYYRHKDGTPTRTAENIRYALRPLIALHGTTRVRDFGPRALKAVREKMVAAGHARTYINSMIGKLKQVFRWGLEQGNRMSETDFIAMIALRF